MAYTLFPKAQNYTTAARLGTDTTFLAKLQQGEIYSNSKQKDCYKYFYVVHYAVWTIHCLNREKFATKRRCFVIYCHRHGKTALQVSRTFSVRVRSFSRKSRAFSGKSRAFLEKALLFFRLSSFSRLKKKLGFFQKSPTFSKVARLFNHMGYTQYYL